MSRVSPVSRPTANSPQGTGRFARSRRIGYPDAANRTLDKGKGARVSRSAATNRAAPAERSERVAYRRLLWVAPLAAAGALVVNLLLYSVGRAAGAFPETVLIPNTERPLSASAVAVNTVTGVIGATIVYALVGLTRRPLPAFRVVAIVVLIGSFTTPFSILGAGFAYRALLLAMHIVVAGASVGLLTTLARYEERSTEYDPD